MKRCFNFHIRFYVFITFLSRFIPRTTIMLLISVIRARNWYLSSNGRDSQPSSKNRAQNPSHSYVSSAWLFEISRRAMVSLVISSDRDWLRGEDQKAAVSICGGEDKRFERTKPCNDTRALSAARWSYDDNFPTWESVSCDRYAGHGKYSEKIWMSWKDEARDSRNRSLSAISSDSFHLAM